MALVGTHTHSYELVEDFARLSAGMSFGQITRVGVDSRDRFFVFQRKDPPVVIFDRDGTYLDSWGSGLIADPHGLRIVNDILYVTDRSACVCMVFTLDGKLLKEIGQRGVHSDTGCEKSGALVPRAAGPFNYPTEMMPTSTGDLYVTDIGSHVHRTVDKFVRCG